MRRRCLVPDLARSVGFGPVFPPPSGALCKDASADCHTHSKLLRRLGKLQEQAPHRFPPPLIRPPLKAPMHGRARAKLPGHGLPLTARAQHEQNAIDIRRGEIHGRPPLGRNSTAGYVARINSHRSSGIRHSTGKLRRRRPRLATSTPPPPRTLRATRGVYYENRGGIEGCAIGGRLTQPTVAQRPPPPRSHRRRAGAETASGRD